MQKIIVIANARLRDWEQQKEKSKIGGEIQMTA